MKRTTPLKRSPFRRKTEGPAFTVEEKPRAQRIAEQRPPRTLHRGVMGGKVRGPDPKSVERRNPHLLAMANGQECLLRISGVCSFGTRTVVACHSNFAEHGKAGARKADDHYTVWGCADCHRWLDQGSASYEEKRRAFDAGHRRQRFVWAEIAYDPYQQSREKPADRKAARWALDQCIADQRAGATE